MKKMLLSLALLFVLTGCSSDNGSYIKFPNAYDYSIVEEGYSSTGSFKSYANILKYDDEEIKLYIEAYTREDIYNLNDKPTAEIYYKYMLEYVDEVDIEFSCNNESIQSIGYSSNSPHSNRYISFISKPLLEKICSSNDQVEVKLYGIGGELVFSDNFYYYETYDDSLELNWNETEILTKKPFEGYLIESILWIMILVVVYRKLYYKNLENYIHKNRKVIKLIDIKSFAILLVISWLTVSFAYAIKGSQNTTDYDNQIDYKRYIDREYKNEENFCLNLSLNKIKESVYGNFYPQKEGYIIDIYFDDEIRLNDHRIIGHEIQQKAEEMTYNIYYTSLDNYDYMYIIVYNENDEIEFLNKIDLDKYK
ncbi:hypothetical protein RI065_05705 [Mycoplasmatota bacterium zrk1]